MSDISAVLGIATTSSKETLTVYRVIVRRGDADVVTVETLERWQSTPQDEARSMADLVDALVNTLDRRRTGAPEALAVKRTEAGRGRPTKDYDQKTRAEGVAMIAATRQGRRYFQYRSQQLGEGQRLHEAAKRHGGYPSSKEEQAAVAAACAALAQLNSGDEADS